MDSLLRKYCEKRKIVLRKGENFHILLTLAWNRVLLYKLKLHKWLHGIKKPIVHYYAVCWNEEKMLPFMFQYYDQFVDHYTIYDNYSDDRSEDIIHSHKNAEIKKFSMNGRIDDRIYQKIKNNCWKHSRGKADYVVVCDIDEFIYHPDLVSFLTAAKADHYSFFKTTGYHMYHPVYPTYDSGKFITDVVKLGVYDFYFNKRIIFDPHRIVEINYQVGAHKARPVGIVKEKDSNGELKMLHYKNLSVEHLIDRFARYRNRLSDINIENKWGEHYLQKEAQVREAFAEGLASARQVIP